LFHFISYDLKNDLFWHKTSKLSGEYFRMKPGFPSLASEGFYSLAQVSFQYYTLLA
jgi:hypothetical protein